MKFYQNFAIILFNHNLWVYMGILQELELDYSLDDIELFLQFLAKASDAFEPLIFNLDNELKFKDALIKLEQNIHNITYSAKKLELGELVKFCEFCEEILKQALKQDKPLSHDFIEWMLLIAAQFESYRRDYENDASFISVINPKLVAVPNL